MEEEIRLSTQDKKQKGYLGEGGVWKIGNGLRDWQGRSMDKSGEF